mmetsp:Transcript_62292/g.197274  ORF Transcript_62292/g.197274 Transcript_62292/m.197274 type:complete len:234 (-) Transcript_62292:400-1101(-)
MRCTCVSMSLAASKLITVLMDLMSRPRAATSVATSTWKCPSLNFLSTSMRLAWSLSPCRHATRKSDSPIFFSTSSTFSLRPQNMSTSPSSTKRGRRGASHGHLVSSLASTSTSCLMSSLASPVTPTVTRTGLERASLAMRWILLGIVALKRRVCRSGRIWPTIDRTCGSKPMSNMRSHSSSTRKVVRLMVMVLFFIQSMSRPGVHTTTSTPALSSLYWSCLFMPPNTPATPTL